MNRREFVTTSLAGVLGARMEWPQPSTQSVRQQFPRLANEVFINGAGGTPLGAFAERGIQRYLDFIRLGPADGRSDYRQEVWTGVRQRFARLIGARDDEIGLVECTKAGEQIAIDSLDALRRGGNVVTNDLHFSGSLHNYEGLRRAGVDVRVVRADRSFQVTADRMAAAMDKQTALVAVSLVSNVNGHIEPVAELSRIAHDHGALLYADIIQAAGAIPIDVHAMGIDVAATSSYKWLFGIHGAGFLFVKRELQGTTLPDHLFPGHVQRNYEPWVSAPDSSMGAVTYTPPSTAERYQPGHVNYLGYAAVYEGMGFIETVGGVAAIQQHSTALVRRLLNEIDDQIDTGRYIVLTPDPDRAPILALRFPASAGLSADTLISRLVAAGVTISVGGDMRDMMRISPAIYNTASDIDRLAEVLDR